MNSKRASAGGMSKNCHGAGAPQAGGLSLILPVKPTHMPRRDRSVVARRITEQESTWLLPQTFQWTTVPTPPPSANYSTPGPRSEQATRSPMPHACE